MNRSLLSEIKIRICNICSIWVDKLSKAYLKAKIDLLPGQNDHIYVYNLLAGQKPIFLTNENNRKNNLKQQVLWPYQLEKIHVFEAHK